MPEASRRADRTSIAVDANPADQDTPHPHRPEELAGKDRIWGM
jgi:hypothetical protein